MPISNRQVSYTKCYGTVFFHGKQILHNMVEYCCFLVRRIDSGIVEFTRSKVGTSTEQMKFQSETQHCIQEQILDHDM